MKESVAQDEYEIYLRAKIDVLRTLLETGEPSTQFIEQTIEYMRLELYRYVKSSELNA